MTKITIRVCSHLAFLETGSDTKAICFTDSGMIMHMVPESAEVSSSGLRNISRVAVATMYMAARGCNGYARGTGERRSFFMRVPEYITRCLYKIANCTIKLY